MFQSYDIIILLMLFSIFTNIIIIIDNKILFIFYIIYCSIIIYNIIILEYEYINNIITLELKNTIKKTYEIILLIIKDLYKSNYILILYNHFKNIIKKTYEIINCSYNIILTYI